MTRQSRCILKELIKIVPTEGTPIEILPYCDCFEIDCNPDFHFDYSEYSKEIVSIIRYLAKNEYVKIDSENDAVFYITHEGYHFRRIRFDKHFEFFSKSVLVPIIVSVISSLIISAIGYLYSMGAIQRKNIHTPIKHPTIEEMVDTTTLNHQCSSSISTIQSNTEKIGSQ